MKSTGKFIISLDFELLWGMRDKHSTETYCQNILGVWEVLPKMIKIFEDFNVKGTFATVGFLFASNKKELIKYCPENKPKYLNPNLSPYEGHFDLVKKDEKHDKFHFASDLIALLQKYPNQEIASHTFSHYYCLEKGQTVDDFRSDIIAAQNISSAKNLTLRSLVFPRNQFNKEYLDCLTELGITSFRGNENIWFHKPSNGKGESLFKRGFRLVDRYINISGHNCYDMKTISEKRPYNIPASRFLSPFSPKLRILENLRFKRVKKSMTYAAKTNKIFHLWWHPHNFSINQEENFKFLGKILRHYKYLNKKFAFESLTMKELSSMIENK
ncbi:polysaccharide deacetylase family protein [Flavobacteriaceae bacterium]|nr:polysaccharide deacetylase family protein [Flavobacteriaceae bacterium]